TGTGRRGVRIGPTRTALEIRLGSKLLILFALEANPSASQETREPCAATRKVDLAPARCPKYAKLAERQLSCSLYFLPCAIRGQYSICFARPACINPFLHTARGRER